MVLEPVLSVTDMRIATPVGVVKRCGAAIISGARIRRLVFAGV
jgi:hypothetical protein